MRKEIHICFFFTLCGNNYFLTSFWWRIQMSVLHSNEYLNIQRKETFVFPPRRVSINYNARCILFHPEKSLKCKYPTPLRPRMSFSFQLPTVTNSKKTAWRTHPREKFPHMESLKPIYRLSHLRVARMRFSRYLNMGSFLYRKRPARQDMSFALASFRAMRGGRGGWNNSLDYIIGVKRARVCVHDVAIVIAYSARGLYFARTHI